MITATLQVAIPGLLLLAVRVKRKKKEIKGRESEGKSLGFRSLLPQNSLLTPLPIQTCLRNQREILGWICIISSSGIGC